MLEATRLFLSALSVRARIAALAFIPVFGFLANGIAFTAGESEVRTAFADVKRAAALSDASNDFKDALAVMRLTVRDFAFRPDIALVQNFDESRKQAAQNLDLIESSLAGPERKDVMALRDRLNDVVHSFADLVKEHTTVGFTSDDGINKELHDAGQKVDRFINTEMKKPEAGWRNNPEALSLLASLLTMRRHEADFRLLRKEYLGQLFAAEFNRASKILEAVNMPDELKTDLLGELKNYAAALRKWGDSISKIEPHVVIINIQIDQMLPLANRIIELVQASAAVSTAALTASQNRTRNFIIWVGIAAVLLGLGASWLIGRTITRPLNGLGSAMRDLADGNTSAQIPRPIRKTRSATWPAR